MAAPKRPIRPAPAERKSGPPIWVKILGGSLLLLVGAHFYLLYQINQFADGIVNTANMFANASHQGDQAAAEDLEPDRRAALALDWRRSDRSLGSRHRVRPGCRRSPEDSARRCASPAGRRASARRLSG